MVNNFIWRRELLRSPLARRLIVAIVLFSLAITLLLTVIQLYSQYRHDMRGIEADLRQIEQVHLKALTRSLWATNENDLLLQLEGIAHIPNFEYVAVREGEKLWSQAGARRSANVIERQYPMVYTQEGREIPLGTLTVVVSLDDVYHQLLTQTLIILASNGLQTFLMAGFAFVFFHWLVNRHLQTMAAYVRGMDVRLPASPLILAQKGHRIPNELDELAAAINHMHEKTRVALTALQNSEEQFQLATEAADVGLWDWDPQNNAVYLSPVFKRQLGYREEEMPSSYEAWESRLHPEDRERALATIQDCLADRMSYYEVEFRLRHKDGSYRWFLSRGALRRNEAGRPIRMLGVQVDITERRRAEEQLGHLAHYDSLTALPNRVLFADRLGQAMIEADRHGRLVGVAFLDLDRFKNINDTLGHDAGDQLLKAVAERLTGAARKGDTVARLSGDEFTLILADIGHVDDVARVAQKILDAFTQPFHIAGRELHMTASLGITLYPFDVKDVSGLLRNADIAMYRAKEHGCNTYRFYAADMMAKAVENLALENDLRHAVDRGELVLHYQPIIGCAAGEILGMEALVRWRHGARGLIPPAQFIPLAEDTGLIVPIGEWVLREACAQCQRWQREFKRPLRVAVNLSARQFGQPPIARTVRRALKDAGLDPTMLELEITESVLLHHDAEKLESLRALAEMGITLTIDDFGTGYSSLSYLKRFPVKALKIDQSFTHDIPDDADDAALARAIINMAHILGLKTIAEGVETRTQFEFFRSERCDAAQGFYFSKPLPAAEFAALLGKSQLATG
jgi:diguanylate cyclase (GGDEF)-like protein/PAS domain S-box-containing protein